MKLPASLLLPLLLPFFLLFSGCAGNPIQTAETPAQKAYALEASYNIILEDAIELEAELEQLGSSKTEVLSKLIEQSAVTFNTLNTAQLEYAQAAADYAEITDTTTTTDATDATVAENWLVVTSINLESWIAKAAEALVQLKEVF